MDPNGTGQPLNDDLDNREWDRMQSENDPIGEKAPKGYFNRKIDPLPNDMEFLNKLLPGITRDNHRYLGDHPEISTIIIWLLIQILRDRPKIHIRKKISSYFTSKSPEEFEHEIKQLYKQHQRHRGSFRGTPNPLDSLDEASTYVGSNITLIEAQKLSSRIKLEKPTLKSAISERSEKSETRWPSLPSQPGSLLESIMLTGLESIQDFSEFVFFVKAADIYNKFMKFSHIPK